MCGLTRQLQSDAKKLRSASLFVAAETRRSDFQNNQGIDIPFKIYHTYKWYVVHSRASQAFAEVEQTAG